MQFSYRYFGEYGNKQEYCCDLYDNDNWIGYCKYYNPSIEHNDAYIEYINIHEPFRRKGYATALLKELLCKYDIKWDYRFTEDGRLWYESLIKKQIIDEQ